MYGIVFAHWAGSGRGWIRLGLGFARWGNARFFEDGDGAFGGSLGLGRYGVGVYGCKDGWGFLAYFQEVVDACFLAWELGIGVHCLFSPPPGLFCFSFFRRRWGIFWNAAGMLGLLGCNVFR